MNPRLVRGAGKILLLTTVTACGMPRKTVPLTPDQEDLITDIYYDAVDATPAVESLVFSADLRAQFDASGDQNPDELANELYESMETFGAYLEDGKVYGFYTEDRQNKSITGYHGDRPIQENFFAFNLDLQNEWDMTILAHESMHGLDRDTSHKAKTEDQMIELIESEHTYMNEQGLEITLDAKDSAYMTSFYYEIIRLAMHFGDNLIPVATRSDYSEGIPQDGYNRLLADYDNLFSDVETWSQTVAAESYSHIDFINDMGITQNELAEALQQGPLYEQKKNSRNRRLLSLSQISKMPK